MQIADRMNLIPFSGIRKVFEEVSVREKTGQSIIHLEIGRPDFDTPLHIKEAAKRALDLGHVHYSSNYGIPELREAIAQKLLNENRLSFDPSTEIIVTVGTNEAVFMAMMALLNPGDEILIPDPCWLHYFYCAHMANAVPVSIPVAEEERFALSVRTIRSFITPRTRMIVINTPNNPTGAVYSAETLEEVAQLAARHDIYVLSDEIYEKLVYDGARHTSIAAFPGMRTRTITINGFSKAYSMTGWRIGYVAADRRIIDALVRIHQYTTVCATTFAQWGAVAALRGPQEDVCSMVAEFDRRRTMVVDALNRMPRIRAQKPEGAFYVFANIGAYMKSGDWMTEYLLDKAGIAVVPGSALGNYGKQFIRVSYANSYNNLRIAMERMKAAVTALQGF